MYRILSGLIPLLTAMALVFAAPPLRAQKKSSDSAGPPQPIALNIKVKREVRTEIPLQIYGRRNELLKYLIRTAPEHGTLTEPRQTQKESAVVVYEPPQDLSITHDKFLFAVQSSEGVSAAVEATITIIDAAPALVIPNPVEFPKILAGTTSTKVIELANHGGGVAAGEMILDGPWRMEGSRSYRIAAGEVAAFKLVFEPKEGGVFEGSISFTSKRELSTVVRGEALAPLSVEPEKIAMENALGDAVRTASFAIRNETEETRTLKIESGPRIQAPDRVTVPAHDKIVVPIQTSASDVASIDEEIKIESEGFSRRIAVKAPALGAMVRFNSSVVDLGRQPAGKPAAGSFEIENGGGTAGIVSLAVSAPFTVEPTSAILQPGGRKTVQIKLPNSGPGKYRTWLKLTTGRQELEIGVEAELYAGAGHSGSPTTAAGSTAPEGSPEVLTAEPVPDPMRKPLKPSAPLDWGVAGAHPAGVTVTEITPASATLAWKDNLSPATRFRVEVRHIGLDASGSLSVTWIEHKPVTFRHNAGQYLATLGELKPEQNWTVRVLPVNDSGGVGERIFGMDFSTPTAPPVVPEVSLIHWLFLALIVCVGVVLWRIFRPQKTDFI